MGANNFETSLKQLGIKLSEKQLHQFAEYYEFLVLENEKYNLTSIIDKEEVYEKHFFDSLSLLNVVDFTNQKVIDLGSGAGFPLIPLKIVEPSIEATALDATGKKMLFIEKLATKLGLKDVKCVVARAEDYQGEKFDICLARGVATMNILLELACNLIKPQGYLAIMKGVNYQQEISDAKHAIDVLGYKIIRVQEVKLDDCELTHYNICLQKVKNHNNSYPRIYAKIKSKPL